MIDLYEKLAIPDSCYLGKKIFKKLFYENAQLNATDKKAFTQDIEDIEWKYTLKPDTINIARYADEELEYDEIAVIQVNLKEPQRYKRIAQIIQRAIPYPLLVVFAHESAVALNVAAKRVNRADREKIMVEEFQDTPWLDLESPADHEKDFLDSLTITSFSYNNFFEFYSDLTERIVGLNCAEFSGVFTAVASNPKHGGRAEILEIINVLQQKQVELRVALKKESQFSRKVELNMQIKRLTEQTEAQKLKL
ncbi:MAG: DUF4391 domain-containing protein [Proteobacteria bacterium]|nr:DUF4391 domain-containing protein [Pseudomonadota bacterium]